MTLSSGTPALQYPIASNITVSGGAVTAVTLGNAGAGFVDTTTVLTATIGGTGSGFSVPVASILSATDNVSIGYHASNNSDGIGIGSQNTLLGSSTTVSSYSNNNSIVIGYDAIGLGSNTTAIGNSSTTLTTLFGALSVPSTANGGALARSSGKTAVTAVTGSLTLATGGVTLLSQVMAAASVWRITAYGTYAAASSTSNRQFTMACYWGATKLTSVTSGNVLSNTAQTTAWQVELEINGSSATAAWCTGVLSSQVTSATIPLNNIMTAASVTGLTTGSTLDFRVGQTGTATAGDTINVHSVVMERME